MYSAALHPKLGDFREVVLLDTEFIAVDGERVVPVALVAHELRSGKRHRLFFEKGQAWTENPLPTGSDILYVAYAAQAEWSTFLALGWELPVHVLDLFAEYRCLTNGLTDAAGMPVGSSLIAALTHYGLDAMNVVEKEAMRDLILRGHLFAMSEQRDILDYCTEDVHALERLLPAMLTVIELPYAIFRGRYTKAVARMEFSGIPIDTSTFISLKQSWGDIKEQAVQAVESEYGFDVYQGIQWSDERFAALLQRLNIKNQWPRTEWGRLSVQDDTFKIMTNRYPELEPLRQVRSMLTQLRELKLTVGSDGRNRCSLAPFRSVTGRNYPPSSKFVFGPSTWLRSLIRPEPGRALAYIDWVSAEFGIAAALSDDSRMKAAYQSGDVYMAFAIDAGAAPAGSTKHTHPSIRETYKTVVLAVQYGQGAAGLATTLGVQEWRAKELLDLHRRVYWRYWQWLEWINQSAMFTGRINTAFLWTMRITSRTKSTTVSNFPMQAHGSELLRWACVFATEAGIEVHAPIQDALLVGGPAEEIDQIVSATQDAMDKACALILDGFMLRSDAYSVRYPFRYIDKRGEAMWSRVMNLTRENAA